MHQWRLLAAMSAVIMMTGADFAVSAPYPNGANGTGPGRQQASRLKAWPLPGLLSSQAYFRGVAAVQPAGATLPNEFKARDAIVADGDTLNVTYVSGLNKREVQVRLYGVDAPELEQPFGAQAKDQLSALVSGRELKVYSKGPDGHDRILAWIFVGGTCINAELVKGGFAWWTHTSAPTEAKLKNLEAQAREGKLGLWGAGQAIAPWDWRNGVRPSEATTAPPTTAPPAEVALVSPPEEKPDGPAVDKADLIITKVEFDPPKRGIGDMIQPIIYYKNVGTRGAKGFYIACAANEVGGAGYGLGGDDVLPPGEERKYLWGGISGKKAGTFEMVFSIDSANKVDEANEKNNTFTATITIDEPPAPQEAPPPDPADPQ